MKILLLEDDPVQAQLAMDWLAEANHSVRHWETGRGLIEAVKTGIDFDLVVLDWEVPDGSGMEVLAEIRSYLNWHVPILFVTQRDAEVDIVSALNAGADDYMVKRASKPEFLARVQALGRRLASAEMDFEVGPYRFLPQSRRAFYAGDEVKLTAKEFDLALYMFRNVGKLLAREQILKDIWQVSGLNTRTVDMHVSRIKKQLQIAPDNGYRIKTIYQHGYRLEALEQT